MSTSDPASERAHRGPDGQTTTPSRPSPTRAALTIVAALLFGASFAACSDDPAARAPTLLDDGGFTEFGAADGSKASPDGSYAAADGGSIRADRFVTTVVSFTPGPCAGFGSARMPDVVLGPPSGAGDRSGGLDVVSLGIGGEIVLSFEPNAIVDGEGADFIVFENAFFAGGDPALPSADLAEISVSEDGVDWKTFDCAPGPAAPYGTCAGWHPVYSAPENGVSPMDPTVAGGDAYDLSAVGLERAKLVRIRDRSTASCEGQPKPTTSGFDLDAIAIVHASIP